MFEYCKSIAFQYFLLLYNTTQSLIVFCVCGIKLKCRISGRLAIVQTKGETMLKPGCNKSVLMQKCAYMHIMIITVIYMYTFVCMEFARDKIF